MPMPRKVGVSIQETGVIKMHGKEINTDLKSEQAREFVKFLISLAPRVKSAADRDGVAITFDNFMWYVPHNYDPNMPPVEELGKTTIVQCKTIEEAGFLCVAKWNQTYADKKFDVPDTLTKVAAKFVSGFKNNYKTPSVLKSFMGIKKHIRSSSEEDASFSATIDGNNSPKSTRPEKNKNNRRYL